MTKQSQSKNKGSKPHTRSPLYDYVLGYPRIATRMALKPETAIFRRFTALNARNLLYMQADLCRLEAQLLVQEQEDNASPVGQRDKYATNYDYLHLSALEEIAIQYDLVFEIQEKLRKYSKWHASFRIVRLISR
jgi:hypothetical protein